MSDEDSKIIIKNYNGPSISGFLGTIFIVLLILKLTNVIDWSWWWIFAPIWIPLVICAIIILCTIIFVLRDFRD